MLVGLDHVQLSIPPGGEDAARSYWVGLLGMVELTKPPVTAAQDGHRFAFPADPFGNCPELVESRTA